LITWLKIGSRNLIKNWRRSLITVLAIAIGFAAVTLFGGFQRYMYNGNREAAIYAGCQGHLMVYKKGFLEKGKIDPARYLLNPAEIKAVQEICSKDPHVVLASPQLMITGLITNGTVSTIFIAQGIAPSAVDLFLTQSKHLKRLGVQFEGRKLRDDKTSGVALSKDLARLLDLKPGSMAVAMTTTADGQMNALDMEVFTFYDVPIEELKDKIMQVPFKFAQTLYDTDGADRTSILLDDYKYTEPFRDQLRIAFQQRGLDLEVQTWQEMSRWYRDVKNMFDVIFLFLFVIVFVIVVMSVTNTMGMSVIERTREIGTLRALGLKRRGVLALFAMESSLLGVCGVIGGLGLYFLGWGWVKLIKPMWVPPRISLEIPIIIEFVPEYMLYTFLFLMILCLFASLVPARRAALQNIVDALGHV
jgi:putative ABC transport system permease protein